MSTEESGSTGPPSQRGGGSTTRRDGARDTAGFPAGSGVPRGSAGSDGSPGPARSTEGAGRGRLVGALWRTPLALWHDDATDRAAALTYYAVLAIFPALLVTVCSIGLAGPDAGGTLVAQVTALVPQQSQVLVNGALREMTEQRSAAWLLASFGAVGALWSSAGYLAVFRRGLHAMYGTVDHRPPWRVAPRIALTACSLLALLVTSAFTLVLTNEAAAALGRLLGMSGAVDVVWGGLKWPLLLALAAVLVLLVFRTGPPGTRRLRRALPGGILAVVLWLLTSAGFALYTAHAGTYNRLYGSLAGIIVFLVWLWVTNLSLLAGAQFNVELARGDAGRHAKAGPTAPMSSDRPESPGPETRGALGSVQQLRLDPGVVPRMPTKRW